MSGAGYDPDEDAIYSRLTELRDELDDAELERDRSFQRVEGLVASSETYDSANSAVQDAVREARRAGMGWDRIGEALGMAPEEASTRFESFDG